MSKKRITTTVSSGITKEQAQELGRTIADATSRKKKIEAQMELKINEVRDKFTTEITTQREIIDEAFNKLNQWAQENRDDEFSKAKSQKWLFGTIGYKLGNYKTSLRKGFKWAAVEELLSAKLPKFIRTKTEVDKESIIASREDADTVATLRECGVEVVQEETFFFDPVVESI